ncbi:MAG: type IV pilus modification PilV family protein [Solirubrobacterales bacterium]
MIRRLCKSEEGFTIIEVLIAALILVLGALATFGILASAMVSSQRAKGSQVALDRAQQEMEYLRSLSDEELALAAAPVSSTEAANPDYRVKNGKFAIKRGTPPSEYKELVIKGGVRYPDETLEEGVVSPGPTSFTSGDVSGKVYRFIVWRNDTSCSSETCPGEQDYKQIIVAVKLDPKGNGGNPGGYVEIQSNFVDPEHSAADNPIPGAEGVVTAQQFFLSDTPCSSSGATSRQEITGDHVLHNTLGTCASGAQTGGTAGAPDTLLTGPPPDPTPEDESTPLAYDYSSDYEGSPSAETAKGIQLRRDSTTGCHYTPENKTAPQWRVHRWVTDPMPKEFKLTSGESLGQVTIDFFTRALSDQQYTGKLCFFLFKREDSKTPPDTMIANREGGSLYWTYTPSWQGTKYFPYGKWGEVIQTLKFNGPVTIPAGARLGVAFSLDASTQFDAVSILYDHPLYRSRIEVDTTTPLEGG